MAAFTSSHQPIEAQELTQETAIGRAEEVLSGWLTTTTFSWAHASGDNAEGGV
jgi:hypothetical protein